MVTALELEAQAHWEVEAARLGAARYHASMAGKELHETAGGAAVLRALGGDLATALRAKARHKAPSADIAHHEDTILALAMDPLVVAFTVLTTALRCASGASSAHRGMPAPTLYTAVQIGVALEVQRDYDNWIAALRKAPADSPEATALAELLRANPASGRGRRAHRERQVIQWGAKVRAVVSEKWTATTHARVGAACLKLLLEVAPGWFEQITTQRRGFETITRIALTQRAQDEMANRDTRAELARPLHMPMLIPPVAWQWEGKEV